MTTLPRRVATGLATTLLLAGCAVPAEAGAAVAPLGGLSAQDLPIVLRLSGDGRTVRRAAGALDLRCTPSGDRFLESDSWRALPIRRDGRFSARVTEAPEMLGDGRTLTALSLIAGRVDPSRTSATGAWSLTYRIADATTGAIVDTCRSGRVRFHVGA